MVFCKPTEVEKGCSTGPDVLTTVGSEGGPAVQAAKENARRRRSEITDRLVRP